MLLILISWIVIAYVSFMSGVAVRRIWVAGSVHDAATTILVGLFTVSIASTALLFFVPARWIPLTLFVFCALVTHIRLHREIRDAFAHMKGLFSGARECFFGCVLLFCLLAFSAQSSKINDDGYYYIQTMMWFSEAGFVKGISNLLLPLGLGSSWHVLQSVFSFDFISGVRLNDLNGLLVFVFYMFCLEKDMTRKGNALLSLMFSAALVVCVPFLSAPSPDLPVMLLTVMAFYLIWSYVNNRTVIDVLVICALAASIKLSAVALVALAIALFFINRAKLPMTLYAVFVVCGLLTIGKNIYQTGYPLYPYSWFGLSELSWATPEDMLEYYTAGVRSWALDHQIYAGSIDSIPRYGLIEAIALLWQHPDAKGAIYKIIVLGFPLILFATVLDVVIGFRRSAYQIRHIVLYAIFVINFMVWLIFAPQYRFILPVFLFFGPWLIWWILKELRASSVDGAMQVARYIALAVFLALAVFPLSLNLIPSSTHIGRTDGLRLETTITPHVSYSFPGIDTLSSGNLPYYHVRDNSYCWDSPLPCTTESHNALMQELDYTLVRQGSAFVLQRAH